MTDRGTKALFVLLIVILSANLFLTVYQTYQVKEAAGIAGVIAHRLLSYKY